MRDTTVIVQTSRSRGREAGRVRQRGALRVLGVIVDFVVVGFGLGALVILIGLAVRDLGPRLSRQSPSAKSDRDDNSAADPRHFALAKDAPAVWARACHSLGEVIMIGGGAIVVATIIGIVGQFADHSGARLVLAAALLAFAAIVLRVGQISNSIYGADRRARARSRAVSFADPEAFDDRTMPDEQTDVPVSATPTAESAVVSAHDAETHSTASNGAKPPLPDLQTLLGERRGGNHQRRDEIVTLEQFLGLAPETPASEPTAAEIAPLADDSSASPATPEDANSDAEPVGVTPRDDAPEAPVETGTEDVHDERDAVSASDEPTEPAKESSEPETSEQGTQTTPDESDDAAEPEKRSAVTDENASTERSNAATEPVVQSS